MTTGPRNALPALIACLGLAATAGAQTPTAPTAAASDDGLVVRPAPPPLEDFEADKNKDGVPDGWYNLRDARVVDEGGVVGPRYMKFECVKPGRPARLSRAFGVDGRKYEAIVVGLWLRVEQIQAGERMGDDPGLIIDFLGDQLRQLTRGSLGPWTMRAMGVGGRWTHVAKRIPVPPGTRDAIMSVGLLGATGVLDVDGVTFELVPVGGSATTNLVKNHDFELGDPDPTGWIVDGGARRASPGLRSPSALELAPSGARAMTPLALPVQGFGSLAVRLRVKAAGLRGGGGAGAQLFFLDEEGRPLPGMGNGVTLFIWGETFDWQADEKVVPVPEGAVDAVLQFRRADGPGSVKIDDVVVAAAPDDGASSWTPYHVEDDTTGWLAVVPSTGVEAKSALDFSFLLDAPAGKRGGVAVRDGRLQFAKGDRARFFGVQFLPPTAFLKPEQADALADRLARSGVNLARLGDLDTPIGPNRSLFDDTRDDTAEFDPEALARLDHMVAALKARGISVALELQGARRFRADDEVKLSGALPPGGGPAAVFDPALKAKAEAAVRALLSHVNPETKLALKDDPALAWVTLAGELTLFDLIDHPGLLPADYQKRYKELVTRSATSSHRFWQATESAHWKDLASALRKDGLRAPVAGSSHYRREPEFAEVQAAAGLDLVDDRLYWNPPSWIAPRWRSMLWSLDGGLIPEANRKRKADRPYVVGQWCDYTQGVWSFPFEAAEQLLAAATARSEDWDALVRRGVFLYPEAWGNAPAGTTGVEDIFQIPEVANAMPQVFALWPHAASIYLRGFEGPGGKAKAKDRPPARGRRPTVPGWEPDRGRLVVDTPYTEGVAGWPGEEAVALDAFTFDLDNPYATVVATSAGPDPLSKSKRVLLTAVARVVPTGFRYVDEWRRETADPGRPPLLAEPVKGKVVWKQKGAVKAFALDNNGRRVGPVKVVTSPGGTAVVLDGGVPSLHFELVAE